MRKTSETSEKPSVASSLATPLLDILCGGGFSIVLMGSFLLLTGTPLRNEQFSVEKLFIVSLLVNYPHFMASYYLLYSSHETVLRYKWAAIFFPMLVFGYCTYALFDSIQIQGRSLHYEILYGVATFYLALHYTGQAWGTMVTFAWLDGIRFSNAERIILRSGFRLLAVWHMFWVAHQDRFVAEDLLWLSFPLHGMITVAAIAAFLIGLVVFCRIWWRTKTVPSIRCIVSWVSIYLWYVLIQVAPGAFFWLQISHALQYMIFPARVAMNRYTKNQVKRPLKPLLASYILLTVLGYITFAGALLISDDPVTITIAGLVAVFVNIHHYFTDGCIWKISNRAVRDDLFAHLRK